MKNIWKAILKIIPILFSRGCGRFALGVIGLGVGAIFSGPWWAPLLMSAAEQYLELHTIPAFMTPIWLSTPLGLALIVSGFFVFYFCPHQNGHSDPPVDPRGVRFRIGSPTAFKEFAERLCRQERLEIELRGFHDEECNTRLRETEERHHTSLEEALLELRKFSIDLVIRPYTVRRMSQTMVMEVVR
ncbi:hypothetical protein [Rhizobium sp. SGZ-381]|uniref:hypothetical protein n=1 Tax=Rhizobium sp. SGZ-381 TaxID=3342800 RepID=UPI00366C935A